MEPNFEKFCIDLNRAPTGNHVVLKTRIKPKEWDKVEDGRYKQTIYVKGVRKSDLIKPVITYPSDLAETSVAAQRQWFLDVTEVSGGTNEITVISKKPTTVPIEVILICIR